MPEPAGRHACLSLLADMPHCSGHLPRAHHLQQLRHPLCGLRQQQGVHLHRHQSDLRGSQRGVCCSTARAWRGDEGHTVGGQRLHREPAGGVVLQAAGHQHGWLLVSQECQGTASCPVAAQNRLESAYVCDICMPCACAEATSMRMYAPAGSK
jgi:hypothetical protein